MPESVIFSKHINNCRICPCVGSDRTLRAGLATDYFCTLVPDPEADYAFRVIAGYVESSREAPQDGKIPDWCPLPRGIPST